jgi:hypothetical protein
MVDHIYVITFTSSSSKITITRNNILHFVFHRPHPHNLVGRDGCKKGVCTVEINSETMSVTFSNLGIQCVKKKDIEPALRTREEIRVDPYRSKLLLLI